MLALLSAIYGAVVARRSARYDDGRSPAVRCTVPVISVGNLSVGGTGKSPVVQMVVRLLQHHGYRPAIVMRGYRRRSKGLVVVHDGASIVATVAAAGDEAFMHARTLDVPVVVCEHKVDAAVHAAGMLPCDVIVVDDGFQHRALHRDVDIVLVDERTIHQPQLLPQGRLREPLTSLRRASIVLLMSPSLTRHDVAPYVDGNVLVTHVVIEPTPLLSMEGSAPRSIADAIPRGERVVMVSGIANPERFRATVAQLGIDVATILEYGDHHDYTKRDVMSVITAARTAETATVITTEKDAVKLDAYRSSFDAEGIRLLSIGVTARSLDPLDVVIMDGIAS